MALLGLSYASSYKQKLWVLSVFIGKILEEQVQPVGVSFACSMRVHTDKLMGLKQSLKVLRLIYDNYTILPYISPYIKSFTLA